TYRHNPIVQWSYQPAYYNHLQKAYILYWRKSGAQNWSDSSGVINTSLNYGYLNLQDSAIYEVQLTLLDFYDNVTLSNIHTIFYDTRDIAAPNIEFCYFPKIITKTDTMLNFTASISDSAPNSVNILLSTTNSTRTYNFNLTNYGTISKNLELMDISQIDKINIQIFFYDDAGNSAALTDTIFIYDNLIDILPPKIIVMPDITNQDVFDTIFTLQIIALDSSTISKLSIEYNDNLILDDTQAIANLNFYEQDSGLIKLKILARDSRNNVIERLLYFHKLNSGINLTNIQPTLISSNITNSLYTNGGVLFDLPDSLVFVFNNDVFADSLNIYLIDELGDSQKLQFSNFSDTLLYCENIAALITPSKKYYFQISGADKNNNNFNENDKHLHFILFAKPSVNTRIIKNNFIVEYPQNASANPFFVNVQELDISNSKVNAAIDSAITILPSAAIKIAEITAIDINGIKLANFNYPLRIGIKYNDSNNDNIIDGSQNLKVDNLLILRLDESAQKFKRLQNYEFDKSQKIIYAQTSELSIWALGYSYLSATDNNLIIFPSGRFANMNNIDKIYFRFQPLSQNYIFKIFSKNGAIVRTFAKTVDMNALYVDVEYDLKDDKGRKIAAGAYFVIAESNTGQKLTKSFIVID
ncbi:MAG TPA: hypothetical protein PLJ38_05055, partial [bacterium]|nr:hypothetical protein [bacterium]